MGCDRGDPVGVHLRLRHITKRYRVNGVLANDDVSLDVREGEIHAIVGENGAGKTTLMEILDGLESPDSGEIVIRGRTAAISSPREASRLGIGMIHQHFRLVRPFTVAENVVLGLEPRTRLGLLDRRRARRSVRELARRVGFDIDPDRRVGDLSVSQMQQVELVGLLYRSAELLVLDEPTTVLTESQVAELFRTLRELAGAGKTVLFISHKLREVLSIADRITVMRRGRIVAHGRTGEFDEQRLTRIMMGDEDPEPPLRPSTAPGEPVYEIRGLTLHTPGREEPALKGIDLTVHRGEIVGVTGISGSGLAELEDTVSAMIHGQGRVTSGELRLRGEDVTDLTCHQLRRRGFAYVPSDRLFRGVSLDSSLSDNLAVPVLRKMPHLVFVGDARLREHALSLQKAYGIEADPSLPVGTLSGGNIQKTILARELSHPAALVLFSEPTSGVDLRSTAVIFRRLFRLKAAGAAVLVISTDMDEILTLSDRIAVMYQGSIVRILSGTPPPTREEIGRLMLGGGSHHGTNRTGAP